MFAARFPCARAVFFCLTAVTAANLGAAEHTYTNPVYAGSMPDPSVIRYGEAYYAFGTTGSERLVDGRIFTVLRSTNLVDWQALGGALEPPSTNSRVQY